MIKEKEIKSEKSLLKTLDGAIEDEVDFGVLAAQVTAHMADYCNVGDRIVPNEFINYVRSEYIDKHYARMQRERK